jgi:7-keto-8-aminopelargonate synthetase-like enzyme
MLLASVQTQRRGSVLSGDSPAFHVSTIHIAALHSRETAFLCNSGYDANLAVIESTSGRDPVRRVRAQQFAHGMRLWRTRSCQQRMISFRHNSTEDLQTEIEQLLTTIKPHKADVIVPD